MIKIICIGKVKELFYREAIAEYQKRLSKYMKLEIIEIPDVTTSNIEENITKEASTKKTNAHQTFNSN